MSEHRLIAAAKEACAIAKCDHELTVESDNIWRTIKRCSKCKARFTTVKPSPAAPPAGKE